MECFQKPYQGSISYFCREQKYSDCTFFYRHFAVEWILSFARLLIPLLCVRSQVTEVYDEIFPLLLANKKNNFYHDMLNCLSFIVNVKAMLCCASNIHRNHSTMRGFFLLYATIKWCIIIIIFYFMSSDNKTLGVEEKMTYSHENVSTPAEMYKKSFNAKSVMHIFSSEV